jgi:hypothetical protein
MIGNQKSDNDSEEVEILEKNVCTVEKLAKLDSAWLDKFISTGGFSSVLLLFLISPLSPPSIPSFQQVPVVFSVKIQPLLLNLIHFTLIKNKNFNKDHLNTILKLCPFTLRLISEEDSLNEIEEKIIFFFLKLIQYYVCLLEGISVNIPMVIPPLHCFPIDLSQFSSSSLFSESIVSSRKVDVYFYDKAYNKFVTSLIMEKKMVHWKKKML